MTPSKDILIGIFDEYQKITGQQFDRDSAAHYTIFRLLNHFASLYPHNATIALNVLDAAMEDDEYIIIRKTGAKSTAALASENGYRIWAQNQTNLMPCVGAIVELASKIAKSP